MMDIVLWSPSTQNLKRLTWMKFCCNSRCHKSELFSDISITRGEYIFLLDRSGSMFGKRIEMAKPALILFLKSLPLNSKFNVVSFGSTSNFLFTESKDYNETSLELAIKEITEMSANMGGTAIFPALCKIYKRKPIKSYPRSIFLLTDGSISNTEEVASLIKAYNAEARVFTIGIGNGCS